MTKKQKIINKILEDIGRKDCRRALKNIGIEDIFINDIDDKQLDGFETIQEGEEPINYPRDPMDLAKDKFLDNHMKGY